MFKINKYINAVFFVFTDFLEWSLAEEIFEEAQLILGPHPFHIQGPWMICAEYLLLT